MGGKIVTAILVIIRHYLIYEKIFKKKTEQMYYIIYIIELKMF